MGSSRLLCAEMLLRYDGFGSDRGDALITGKVPNIKGEDAWHLVDQHRGDQTRIVHLYF